MGRVVPELRQLEIRELIVDKTYRLIYKVGKEYIFVIALKHGRQNLDVTELEQRADFEE
jgi:plasmid stabilization system protein ParE